MRKTTNQRATGTDRKPAFPVAALKHASALDADGAPPTGSYPVTGSDYKSIQR